MATQNERSKDKYTLVNVRKGGGLRALDYPRDEAQTVGSLLAIGKNLFFPNGKKHIGNIEEMDISLSNYSGDEFTKFKDRNGNPCSFQYFLKSYGFFSSQYYFYLKTSKKEVDINEKSNEDHENENEDSVCMFTINGLKPSEVKIKYTRNSTSGYSGCPIAISCFSMNQCLDISYNRQLSDDDLHVDYNALDDGFKAVSVEIGKKVFLSYEDKDFTFPQCMANDCEIIHGPAEICGFERDDPSRILLGVITKNHNTDRCLFSWYKDGDFLSSSCSKCILPIWEEGIYTATVSINDMLYTFDTFVDTRKTCLTQTSEISGLPTVFSGVVSSDTKMDQHYQITQTNASKSHLDQMQTCLLPSTTVNVPLTTMSSDGVESSDTRMDQITHTNSLESKLTCSLPSPKVERRPTMSSDGVVSSDTTDQSHQITHTNSLVSSHEGLQTCSTKSNVRLPILSSGGVPGVMLSDTRMDQRYQITFINTEENHSCSQPTPLVNKKNNQQCLQKAYCLIPELTRIIPHTLTHLSLQ